MAVGWTESAGEHGRVAPAMLARAAEYVRMSTEHQKYSTENQAEAMQQYAARRGIEIVRTYADAGKSGLSLDGRDGLKQLIEDVQNKTADFTTILVYDISRWGRFQDADESAYYEYICKRAGISVQYCAEQFENDEARSQPSSRALNVRWPANTAANFLSRSSRVNAV